MNLGQSSTEKPDAGAVKVSEIMNTSVISVRPQATVQEAAEMLSKHSIGALLVIDGESKLLGILSDDDLLVEGARLHIPTVFGLLGDVGAWPPSVFRFERELRVAFARTVSDAMTKKVVCCAPEDTVEAAATLMHDRKVRLVPVIANERVVGVITRSDVLRFLFKPATQ